MFQLIDRRLNAKGKSAVNRERFLRRYRQQIKEAVAQSVKRRGVTDIAQGEQVSIPRRDLNEPSFGHGQGGIREVVQPGNEQYITGDKIDRPPGGAGGRGNRASEDGEGEDDFRFTLSREEYLNYLFEDLALPNLVKEHLAQSRETRSVRVGFTADGLPSNLNVVRSLRGAIGRRIALGAPLQSKVSRVETELELLRAEIPPDETRIKELEEEILALRGRILRIPYLDPFDLRYVNRVRQPKPSNKAVMFCLMDVSGSMDENRKDIAKRFFILLYLFLTRAYDTIELVFIRHHTQANEVSEHDFFESRETGGTIVSSALKLMHDIATKRYSPEEWNIYVAQASDGDNWHDDSPICRELIDTRIMPLVQYFAYIEITEGEPQNLWEEYEKLTEIHRFFAMRRIATRADIYPVFRELFKAQTGQT